MAYRRSLILRLSRGAALLAVIFGSPACEPPSPARRAPTPVAISAVPVAISAVPVAPPPAPVSITILYTADEHGWLLPLVENGVARGGAAEVLSHWIAREGHCPGPLPNPSCADPATLLLSGGDNFTGPAISSFYGGLPMAEAMARMGYAASAFGNHELDFGRDQLIKNQAVGGFPYIAANMRVTDPRITNIDLKSFLVFNRRGIKIGVVGLATDTTLTTASKRNFEGIDISAEEPALERAVAEAWSAGPDALIAVIHECPDKLEPILARHPEWRLSFVGGGHCHRVIQARVGDTPLISPGWRLHSYARVRMSFDTSRAERERVISVEPEVVQVSHPEGASPDPPPDPAIDSMRSAWKARLDEALGEPIAYTNTGIPHRSAQLGRWIGDTWRKALGAEVAIVNSGALRQAVPKGVITKATIYSVLPFDNKLVVCTLTGRDLLEDLAKEQALSAGVKRLADGRFVLSSGKPIEPDRKYSVVTIDYLYFGGAGFQFQKQDPAPKETGLDWRGPVLTWTKEQKTTPARPLEGRILPP